MGTRPLPAQQLDFNPLSRVTAAGALHLARRLSDVQLMGVLLFYASATFTNTNLI